MIQYPINNRKRSPLIVDSLSNLFPSSLPNLLTSPDEISKTWYPGMQNPNSRLETAYFAWKKKRNVIIMSFPQWCIPKYIFELESYIFWFTFFQRCARLPSLFSYFNIHHTRFRTLISYILQLQKSNIWNKLILIIPLY